MGKVLSVVHAWVATLCTITETPVHFNKDDTGTLGGALPEVPLSPSVRALCVSLLSTVFQVYNDPSQLVTHSWFSTTLKDTALAVLYSKSYLFISLS